MGNPPPAEEQGTTHDQLTTDPIPHHPMPLWGEEVEKIRSEAESLKKAGVGGRCFFKICFYF